MKSDPTANRRKTERIPVEYVVKFFFTDEAGKRLNAESDCGGVTLDISKTGIAFIADNADESFFPSALDNLVNISLVVTLSDGEELELDCRLAWIETISTEEAEDRYFLGVEYMDAENAECKRIFQTARDSQTDVSGN